MSHNKVHRAQMEVHPPAVGCHFVRYAAVVSEFDTLLQANFQPDMEKYLGEYETVAQWN